MKRVVCLFLIICLLCPLCGCSSIVAAVLQDQTDGWITPLPEGLTADIQLMDDHILLVWYKNNTGSNISISTFYSFENDTDNMVYQGEVTRRYFRNGDDYIAILYNPAPITAYKLDCSIDSVYPNVQAANDALTVVSSQNDDGSVSVSFSSADIDLWIFFLDADRKIVAYEPFDSPYPTNTFTFSNPGFEYSDYVLCYERYVMPSFEE